MSTQKITQSQREQYKDKKKANRKFEGVWIPKGVWLSHDLKPLEKFLLIEIDSYVECFCSNRHFALELGVSASRVSQIISKLVADGWITVKNHYKKDSKELDKRVLSVSDRFRKLKQGVEETKAPTLENCEDINTNIINTNIKNSPSGTGACSAPDETQLEAKQDEKPDPVKPKSRQEQIKPAINIVVEPRGRTRVLKAIQKECKAMTVDRITDALFTLSDSNRDVLAERLLTADEVISYMVAVARNE